MSKLPHRQEQVSFNAFYFSSKTKKQKQVNILKQLFCKNENTFGRSQTKMILFNLGGCGCII